MSLTPADLNRLARILRVGHAIERAWPKGDRAHTADLNSDSAFAEFKREVAACAGAESESLKRLAGVAAHLHPQISLAHFYACLVPFERLASRGLRDDEFLVEEGDGARAVERVPLKLIVENVRSAFNVGALFRTGECLGVSEIWLCGYTPGPDDEKTKRTAMGTDSLVPWQRADRAVTACEELRRQGYRIVALETANTAVSLYESRFDGHPVAFVLGNERFGLEGDTLQVVDSICRIPLRGSKNSLNAGIAFGVAAFEWLRQFEKAPR